MFEYLKSIDKDSIEFITESCIAEYDIERDKISNEYNMAIKMLNLNESEESSDTLDKSKVTKFKDSAVKMLKAVSASTGKALDNVANKLTGENPATIKDYLDSKEGSIRLEKDITKIQKDVRDEARKGDELLQKIASTTGVSDEVVDNFVQSTIDIFDRHGDAVITAAAAAAVYANQVELYDAAKKRDGKDGIFQQCNTAKSQTQATRVINAINNMYNKELRLYGVFMNKFNALKKKEEA